MLHNLYYLHIDNLESSSESCSYIHYYVAHIQSTLKGEGVKPRTVAMKMEMVENEAADCPG